MSLTPESVFLEFSAKRLRGLVARIETCLGRLTPDQIWLRGSENANAVGNLCLHLAGNVRQWIGYGVAGQPDIRVRDREFAARGNATAAELLDRLSAVVNEAATIIETLPHADLMRQTQIQNYDATVMEAIYHVVEHFAGHTSQIIYATKAFTGEDLGFYSYLNPGAAHSQSITK